MACEAAVKISMGAVNYELLVGNDVERDVLYMELTNVSGKVPVVLSTSSDPIESRVASLVLSLLVANHQRTVR